MARVRCLPLVLLLQATLLLGYCCRAETAAAAAGSGKVCVGTSFGASSTSSSSHAQDLRERYENCSVVSGNLELTWLDSKQELDFLEHVVEVTGYVLINNVDVRTISLPRLRLIRGRSLFREEFALYVAENSANDLELPALGEILVGSVGVFNNKNLCHLDTINWDEIITDQGAGYRQGYNLTKSAARRHCNNPQCHRSCDQRACWAEGAHNCQRFTKIGCSTSCDKSNLRCFGPNQHQCCHAQCAVGCTGPRRTDCLACKYFDDEGTCKPKCPRRYKFNSTTNTREVNPKGKYTYVSTCVSDCPEGLFKDNEGCVHTCPPKKYALKGECVVCEGVCPKICPGSFEVGSKSLFAFENCTIIDGSINIHLDLVSQPEKLEVFSTINTITGFLQVEGLHGSLKDLSCFRNLETIEGQILTKSNASLYIANTTSLTALGLTSLKRIAAGNVVLTKNWNLCYADTVQWDQLQPENSTHENVILENKNGTDCRHLICDDQCTESGCSGPGPHHCQTCRNFVLKNVCVSDCKLHGSYLADPEKKICKNCHKDCLHGVCTGPKLEDCEYPAVTSKAQCKKIIDTCSKLP